MANRILSCFIDESGDFGPYKAHSPYYYVAFVLHEQNYDISDKIIGLNQRTINEGFSEHAIHTGPLIRRESYYEYDTLVDRKHLFNILYFFVMHLPIKYFCIRVDKKECADSIKLTGLISKALSDEIDSHTDYWKQFDQINIYYDNGQTELTKIITSVFYSKFSNVDMRRVRPVEYKLFQVADLICTMEMIHDKEACNRMTRSELEFFDGRQKFRKDYYRKISSKRLI